MVNIWQQCWEYAAVVKNPPQFFLAAHGQKCYFKTDFSEHFRMRGTSW